MKYMTFNSSCSYAALSNMLINFGIDTTDREIALKIKLPYMFDLKNDVFMSGPMLQSKEWFNLYVNPLGLKFVEAIVHKELVPNYLRKTKTAMLGIKLDNGNKHAVVYQRNCGGHLFFLNNRRENDNIPDEISFTDNELIDRLDDLVTIGTLVKTQPIDVNIELKLESSIIVLEKNLQAVKEISAISLTLDEIKGQLNTLFRPLFLDSIDMLKLIDEIDLANGYKELQDELMSVLRKNSNGSIKLQNYLSINKLETLTNKYLNLIKNNKKSQ